MSLEHLIVFGSSESLEQGAGTFIDFTLEHQNFAGCFSPDVQCENVTLCQWFLQYCQILVSLWIFLWTRKPCKNPSVFTNFSIYHPGRTAEDKGQEVGEMIPLQCCEARRRRAFWKLARSRWGFELICAWPGPLPWSSHSTWEDLDLNFIFCSFSTLERWIKTFKTNQKLNFGVLGQIDSIWNNGCNFSGDVPILAEANFISGHREEHYFWQPHLPWQCKLTLRRALVVFPPPSSPHVPDGLLFPSLSPPMSILLLFSWPVQRADLPKICQEEEKKKIIRGLWKPYLDQCHPTWG